VCLSRLATTSSSTVPGCGGSLAATGATVPGCGGSLAASGATVLRQLQRRRKVLEGKQSGHDMLLTTQNWALKV